VGPVRRICQALDDMPLTFELAAAGVRACPRSPRSRSQRG
jgi:predicted ATPase